MDLDAVHRGASSKRPCFADFSGKVIGVIDGDTIDVLNKKTPIRIRLQGIGCPEKGQAFGKRAKQAASALAFGKEVTEHGKGKYGRTIADVILPDGASLNQELVKQGWCWWFRKSAPADTSPEQTPDLRPTVVPTLPRHPLCLPHRPRAGPCSQPLHYVNS